MIHYYAVGQNGHEIVINESDGELPKVTTNKVKETKKESRKNYSDLIDYPPKKSNLSLQKYAQKNRRRKMPRKKLFRMSVIHLMINLFKN